MWKRLSTPRRYAHLALIVLLVACTAERPEASLDPALTDSTSAGDHAPEEPSPETDDVEPSADLITPDGWGTLRIGMSRAKVVAAAGGDANPDAVGGPEPEQCDEFHPVSAPDGVLVMLEKGVLTRVSVSRNSEIETPEGFAVGDSASDLIDAYGSRALVTPHKYLEAPARYITIWRDDSSTANRRGIRYEIDPTGHVTHIRAGESSIEYVEGCL